MNLVQGSGLPAIEITKEELEAGVSITDLLVMFGWCKSKGEARRLIQQGGVRLGPFDMKKPPEGGFLEVVLPKT